jgi:hypothetical protein
MKLKFYGTRGSIPICDAGFQQFGGNTTCLQITDTNQIAIIDAGTGLRNLGRDLLAIDPEHDDEFLERIEKLCRERFPNAALAREGMEISIGAAT